ncbi:ornithine decarboxylase-like [Tigriopus californicus]|nr:ornithine decarboxylase-like [Tigriopus californicus]
MKLERSEECSLNPKEVQNCPYVRMSEDERLLMQQIAYSGDQEEAFLICDQAKMVQALDGWTQSFPDIKPSFDVFQNGQELVLQMFQGRGCSFVCKNKDEIAKVVKAGIPGEDIILENSMLVASHLKVAARENVGTVVFRSPKDLTKVKKSHPNAKLFLAIDWSSLNEANELALESIQNATDLDLHVTGVFMVGHLPIGKAQKALGHLRLLFDKIQEFGPQDFEIIHLGALGSIPEEDLINGLKSNFPDNEGRVLEIQGCLPNGLLESAFSLCARIVGKRAYQSNSQSRRAYVLNEGVYGCFNQELHADDTPTFQPRPFDSSENLQFPTMLIGPSGDATDELEGEFGLPDLEEGDWIVFPNIGRHALGSANPKSYEAFAAPSVWSESENQLGLWIFMEEPLNNGCCKSQRSNSNNASVNGITLEQLQVSLQDYHFEDLLPEMLSLTGLDM